MLPRRAALACALSVCAVLGAAGTAGAQTATGVEHACYAPAGDPQPGSSEWLRRDALNQWCASLRPRDQLQSPAFGFGNLTQGAALYAEQTAEQLAEPTRPRGGVTTRIPGAKAADPFRTIRRWTEAGRGRVSPVRFRSSNGAVLRGHVFAPPAHVPRPASGWPGVVITDGSVQAYEELYFWAAQDLAESGYLVMTYDVQGQGDSDLLGEDCPGRCSGVPYQQNFNFLQGAEDSLSFFLSTPASPSGGSHNPWSDHLDRDRVGLAGHSLGASAVSVVGQCDSRVRTIVAWDNLRSVQDCAPGTLQIDPRHRSDERLVDVPALAVTNDYGFWTTPHLTRPDGDAKTAGFEQVAGAGLDAQIVALRGATHLAYTHIPLVFQSNQLGERMASYFTKAWFDLQLKGDPTGFDRLTAERFDDSVDVSSIGAGTYDPARADPRDPYSGNVPYLIEGIRIDEAVSFLFRSAWSLRDPVDGRRRTCHSMRDGCGQAAGRPGRPSDGVRAGARARR